MNTQNQNVAVAIARGQVPVTTAAPNLALYAERGAARARQGR